MKFFYKNIFMLLLIILSSAVFAGCQDTSEPDDTYSFEIISSGDSFIGYYKLDGEAAVEFSSVPMGTSTFYHTYLQNLDAPESILISVTGMDQASSISIYVYEESELVKSTTVSQITSGVAVTATLSYTFGSSTTAATTTK